MHPLSVSADSPYRTLFPFDLCHIGALVTLSNVGHGAIALEPTILSVAPRRTIAALLAIPAKAHTKPASNPAPYRTAGNGVDSHALRDWQVWY